MANEKLLTALYERMAAEQARYRQWPLGQPPGESLNRAYEYTIREDIVMEMEKLELTDAQAKEMDLLTYLRSYEPDTIWCIFRETPIAPMSMTA